MTRDEYRELFESEMKKSNKYAPSLMKWENDRYEFYTMHAAYCGFCVELEAKQVEVKMPEPVGIVTNSTPREPGWRTTFVPPAGTKLYTEQQLRTLLAQHGIKIAD